MNIIEDILISKLEMDLLSETKSKFYLTLNVCLT